MQILSVFRNLALVCTLFFSSPTFAGAEKTSFLLGGGIDNQQVSVANEHDFLIQHFEPSGSMLHTYVNSICQDGRGFLWFGTDGGVFRYDGYDLVPVELPGAHPGFKRIRSICEDSSGDIWIGTNGGLFRYSHATGKAAAFNEEDLVFSIVSKLMCLPSGNLVVNARNYGVLVLDPRTGRSDFITYEGGEETETVAVCQDNLGKVYIYSPNAGLLRAEPSRSMRAVPVRIVQEDPLKGIVPYNIEYYDSRIIAGVAENTVIYDMRSGLVTQRDWSVVNGLLPRGDKGFYLATNRGFMAIGSNFEVEKTWGEEFSDPYALQDKSIRAACTDREGNIWLGTRYAGVFQMARNRADIRRFYPVGDPPSFGRRIREIVEDEDGVLWIGSENGGLMRYDPATDELKRIPLPLGTSNILALCVDGPWLWIGSYSRVDPTLRLDRRNFTVKAFPELPKCIYHMFKAPDGVIFMSDDAAVYRYDSRTGALALEERISPQGFQYVSGISGEGNELWLGGTGSLLYSYKNGKLTTYTEVFPNDRNIYPKLMDHRSRLWFSPRDYGLFCLDTLSGEVRHYETLPESGPQIIYMLAEDREGIIWITTSNGLVTLDPDNGNEFRYDRSDGILSGEFNEFSACISSQGILYAGLLDGMMAFDPVKFRSYPYEVQKPVFTSFKLLRSANDSFDSSSVSFAEALESGRITLKASQNAFVLGVSAMTYSIPRRSKLVFSVDGGKEWEDVVDGKIQLSRLKPGKYVLRVRSVMNDGTPDDKESVLNVHVRVPLLASFPFVLIYMALLIGLLIAVSYTVRRRSLRKAAEKARLDAEVREAERQKELWSSKVAFLTDVAHEIRNPLSLVKAPVESLRQRLGKSADGTVVREIDIVSRNADKLSEMLDSLLEVHVGKAYMPPGIKNGDNPAEAAHPRMNVPGTGKSVLIVEQDAEIMEFLCARLEDEYNVYSARSTREANKILEENRPDIILCDTDTGTTESYAFCTELKSVPETAPTPLIVISDNSGPDARVDALNRGAEGFFSKPFSIAELMGAIRSLLVNRDIVKDSITERPSVSADKDFLKTLQLIMKAHLSDENLSVDTLAEEACMSSSSLFKKLKSLTGMSPGEYITATRMKEAASLMKNTALTIDDISIKVGFRSHSYFSTCFKNRYGMSPKKFRQLSEPSSES